MDIRNALASQVKRYEELNRELAQPETGANRSLLQRYGREHAELEALVQYSHALLAIEAQLAELQEIREDRDPVLQELASEEIERLNEQREEVLHHVKVALLPKDPLSPKNAVVTIQPETESDKTAPLALWRMYSRYATVRGWTIGSLTSLEDFPHATFVVSGKGAYGRLKYEAGLHAFQPAPMRASEGSPRSIVRVTVLPAIDEEFEIEATDLMMGTYRVLGPAGEGAQCHIGITHVPTGLKVWFRNNESPKRKQQIALCVLKALLWEREAVRGPEQLNALPGPPVHTEQRHALIRTYDEGRKSATDHRMGSAQLPLANVLFGELDAVIDQLIAIDQAKQLLRLFET
jgi:peptide chain release factor 1